MRVQRKKKDKRGNPIILSFFFFNILFLLVISMRNLSKCSIFILLSNSCIKNNTNSLLKVKNRKQKKNIADGHQFTVEVGIFFIWFLFHSFARLVPDQHDTYIHLYVTQISINIVYNNTILFGNILSFNSAIVRHIWSVQGAAVRLTGGMKSVWEFSCFLHIKERKLLKYCGVLVFYATKQQLENEKLLCQSRQIIRKLVLKTTMKIAAVLKQNTSLPLLPSVHHSINRMWLAQKCCVSKSVRNNTLFLVVLLFLLYSFQYEFLFSSRFRRNYLKMQLLHYQFSVESNVTGNSPVLLHQQGG